MSQTAHSSSEYRRDIDGLRAIAVVSVMIFHARDTLLPGGFVGVDIFFVISGYLISKHIASEAVSGRFSLAEFYRRRIRRIAPMMLTVVAATLAMAMVVMTPEDATAVAKSAVWSVASLANVHFWRDLDTGYFANSSMEVPLLHLWSLGVEEQFYILWPLILAVAVRRVSLPLVLAFIAGVAVLSFAAASAIFPGDPMFAYYMLPTRAGELLLGALVGVASAQGRLAPSAAICRLAGIFGFLLIAGSLCLLDRLAAFPGWLAVPPTLGAALVILAGEGRHAHTLPGLSSRPMVFVGKLSYSAYLWHWPLFAFYRYGFGEPDLLIGIVVMVITMLLAWASFEFIERPTRSTAAGFRTVAWRQFVLPGAALVLPSILVVYGPRFGIPIAPASYLERLARVRDVNRPANTFEWICQRQRLTSADLTDRRCVLGVGGGTPPRLLLWGDSNAAHYVPMVREFAMHAGIRFRNVSVDSCPPLLVDPAVYVEARRLADCRHSAALVGVEISKFSVIAISADWTGYAMRSPGLFDDVAKLAGELAAQGHQVILIGKIQTLKGFDRRCTEKALRVPFKTCPTLELLVEPEVESANEKLRNIAQTIPNVRYFDANRWLCPNKFCSEKTPAGMPRYFDSGHLSVKGSEELGRSVLEKEGMPNAFSFI